MQHRNLNKGKRKNETVTKKKHSLHKSPFLEKTVHDMIKLHRNILKMGCNNECVPHTHTCLECVGNLIFT